MLHAVSGKISADSPDWFSAVCYACKYRNIFALVSGGSRSRKVAALQSDSPLWSALHIERTAFDNHSPVIYIYDSAAPKLSAQSNRIAHLLKLCKVYRLRIVDNAYQN